MKNNIQYTFFLFFISFVIHSQTKEINGEITYNASFQYNEIIEKVNEMKTTELSKNLLKSSIKKSSDIKFILKFNRNESLFMKEKKIEENKKNFTEILVAAKGFYYSNALENDVLQQKESFGDYFLISIPTVKWNLTQDKKKIGDYICYKATTEKKAEGRNGSFTKKIVAWYTQSIPFNYGPKEYKGLPGVILELQEGEILFKAIEIKLNPTKNKIVKPNKGKKVTLEEYNKIVKEIVTKYR